MNRFFISFTGITDNSKKVVRRIVEALPSMPTVLVTIPVVIKIIRSLALLKADCLKLPRSNYSCRTHVTSIFQYGLKSLGKFLAINPMVFFCKLLKSHFRERMLTKKC
ncbi:hypothetical protein SAMN05444682_11355 [Parapedobacter indicus]|uniref:Uncharacterized protein n=1 Tax=Parapedobacter indicus TaxID=1477437 RepID=A0A1I3TT56_9SPHI|nr:hypothetical protein CLV26_11355 [Parapedobacter indicus]SFJ73519.1 hypothetical protein SAMN05444682_11355 [Parapedobacter indicus]